MVEVVSVSHSVARLFTSAVLAFEFVQVARSSGVEYETCQLRLDAARYRLSEWGSSIGLGERSHPDALFAYDDMKKKRIERTLRQINRLFDRAREDSSTRAKELYVPRKDMSSDAVLLHDMIVQLTEERSRIADQPYNERDNLSSFAITDDKTYRKLVGDMIGMTDDLIALSSLSSIDRQRRMCRDVIILIEAKGGDIKRLADAVTKVYPEMAKNITRAIEAGGAALLAQQDPDLPDFIPRDSDLAPPAPAASLPAPSSSGA